MQSGNHKLYNFQKLSLLFPVPFFFIFDVESLHLPVLQKPGSLYGFKKYNIFNNSVSVYGKNRHFLVWYKGKECEWN